VSRLIYCIEAFCPPANSRDSSVGIEDSGTTRIFYPTYASEEGMHKGEYVAEQPASSCLHVRLMSDDRTKQHTEFSQIHGKRVRISVEILDE
jgi:hypothetical protein